MYRAELLLATHGRHHRVLPGWRYRCGRGRNADGIPRWLMPLRAGLFRQHWAFGECPAYRCADYLALLPGDCCTVGKVLGSGLKR